MTQKASQICVRNLDSQGCEPKRFPTRKRPRRKSKMSRTVAIEGHTTPNIISLFPVITDQEGRPSAPPLEFPPEEESFAIGADPARITKFYLELRRVWIAEAPTMKDTLLLNFSSSAIPDNLADFSFQDVKTEPHSTIFPAQRRLEVELRASFEADPLEDGIIHPAEEIISEALQKDNDKDVLEWLRSLSLNAAQSSFAASVLRCLGRHSDPGTDQWRAELVRDGLAVNDIEIRDAAVQAAESWGDPGLIEVLESHSDPQTWLRDYIHDVINDLR